jgi:diamine N-acetyltransferase
MIYSERIRLRSVEKADLPTFVAWLSDPEVTEGLALYRSLSMAEEEQWFEKMLTRPQDERPFVIEARTEDGWEVIGNLAFFDIKWRERSAELGIMIGEKRYWNQGYGGDALRALLKFGFDTLNLHRVFLRVYETNQRAIRAYEKIGFVHEGRMRQAEYKMGRYIDVYLMSILRSEWKGEP